MYLCFGSQKFLPMEADRQGLRDNKEYEDCFYFLSSECKRGDQCSFRHNEIAKSSSTLCPKWDQTKECTFDCPNRHSYYQFEKSKGSDFCYFEVTLKGCRKPYCEFRHRNPEKDAWKNVKSVPEGRFMPIPHAPGTAYLKLLEEQERLESMQPKKDPNYGYSNGDDLDNNYYSNDYSLNSGYEKPYYGSQSGKTIKNNIPRKTFVSPHNKSNNDKGNGECRKTTRKGATTTISTAAIRKPDPVSEENEDEDDDQTLTEATSPNESHSLQSPSLDNNEDDSSYQNRRQYVQSENKLYYDPQNNYFTTGNYYTTDEDPNLGKEGDKIYEDVVYFQSQVLEEKRQEMERNAYNQQHSYPQYNQSAQKSVPNTNYFNRKIDIPSKIPSSNSYNYQEINNEQQFNIEHRMSANTSNNFMRPPSTSNLSTHEEYDLKERESPISNNMYNAPVSNFKKSNDIPAHNFETTDVHRDRYEASKTQNGNKAPFYSCASKTPIKSYGYAKKPDVASTAQNSNSIDSSRNNNEDYGSCRKQLKNNMKQKITSLRNKGDTEFIESIRNENKTLDNEIAEIEDEIAWVSQFLNKIQNTKRR